MIRTDYDLTIIILLHNRVVMHTKISSDLRYCDFFAGKMYYSIEQTETFVLPLEHSDLPLSMYSRCDILNR